MKKISSVFLISLFAFSISFGQKIPDYVFPNELIDKVDNETKEKVTLLNDEMNRGVDPSFKSVSSIFPGYMDYPKAIVGIKEHHGRFLSSWDGAIIFPPFYLSFEVLEGRGRFFCEAVPFSDPVVKKNNNSLLGDYLPVINREFEYNGVIYEQTLFAYSENFSTENPLIAFVRMRAKNTQNVKKENTLSVCFKGTGARPATQIWATSGYNIINCPMMIYSKGNKILNESGDAIFWSESSDGAFGENKYSYTLSLNPNEVKELYFCIPYEPIKKDATIALSKACFDEIYDKVGKYWDGIIRRGMQINVPEKIVNDAYKTWHINNFLLVQEDISRMTYKTIDAPFFYEGIFGYAAAMYLNTITIGGYYEEAKKCAKMFLRLQNDDGSISGVNRSNGIIPHQHGAILYTISQIYRMGRDREWFTHVAPDLINGCEWIIRERSKTKNLVNGKKEVSFGLLPPYRSNVDNGPGTQEYCGNAWCWAGLNQVGLALKELGGNFKKEGIRLQKEADLYRADILASMDKATMKDKDLLFIPLDIAIKKPYEHMLESTEGVYYGMISSRMLESEIFNITDERMSLFLNFFEKRNGIILGLTRHVGKNGLGFTAHFSAGYGISNLRMGKLDRSLLNFYGMLSYGMARNLYSTQEHDNFIEGKNDSWYWARQPHLHSTSELIRITNKMLVFEDRDQLMIAHGVPRKWLENGKTIEVKNAQTCFGPLSYRIHSNVSEGMINAEITCLSSINVPSLIKLKIRHPDGKSLTKVEVNGKVWKNFGKEIINLPGSIKEYSIVAYY